MAQAKYRLGDHEFISPEEQVPLSRLDQELRKPIRGADAPTHLRGVVVEARGDGPSSSLMNGEFCGHGEPTFTVFDVEIDGSRDVELAVETDEEIDEEEMDEDDEGPMIRRVLARRAGSDSAWTVLHDVAWGMDEGGGRTFPWCPHEPEMDDDADIQPVETEDGEAETFRVSIGLEYPPDAQSVGDVSWVAIVAVGTEQDGEEVFCVVSEEMA